MHYKPHRHIGVKVFRRHGSTVYKHMLLSDSEIESDDNLSNVAVTVAKDGKREREKEEKRSPSTHQHAKSLKSKQSLDPGYINLYLFIFYTSIIFIFNSIFFTIFHIIKKEKI